MEDRYWHEDRRLGQGANVADAARGDRATRWSQARYALGVGDRDRVAERLGWSVRSLVRFEADGPTPAWYQLALVGLAYIEAHGVENLPPAFRAVLHLSQGKANRRQVDSMSAAS